MSLEKKWIKIPEEVNQNPYVAELRAERDALRASNAELLVACKAALNMVSGDGQPPNWDLLRAAIAKAEG